VSITSKKRRYFPVSWAFCLPAETFATLQYVLHCRAASSWSTLRSLYSNVNASVAPL
jgi:hypothetical protein